MLKRLAIFVTWLICAGIMSGQGNKNSSPDPHPAKQEQPALTSENREQSQSHAGQEHAEPGDVPPRGNTSLKWPQWIHDSNWWLVIVAALTGGVICWQSWELHEQTRHMVNKERARIDVSAPNGPLELDDGPEWTEGLKVVHAGAQITVSNFGGTRAFNVVAEARFIGPPEGALLGSEEVFLLDLPGTIKPDIEPITVEVITLLSGVNHVAAVNDGTEVLYLVGRIVYEDVFGKKRATPFRYRWEVDVSQWKKTARGNRST